MEQETSSRSIRNQVIATLLAAGSLWLLGHMLGLWLDCWHGIQNAYRWLSVPLSAPRWVAIIAAIAVVFIACRTVLYFRKLFSPQSPQSKPIYLDYRTDVIFDVRWRWGYLSGVLDDLRPYCPSDDTHLVYDEPYGCAMLHCETCGRNWGPFDTSMDGLRGKVARQLDKKLRHNEFPRSENDDGGNR
jgi:hypothetical protein